MAMATVPLDAEALLAALRDTARRLKELPEQRDRLIREGRAIGIRPATLADAADIGEQRVFQILRERPEGG
jgi:hypothetical protein